MSDNAKTEATLIQEARKGDRYAFEELVHLHSSYVYNLAYHLTAGNHSEADDLAQMTFIRAFRAIRRFEGRSELRTWLHRITVNLWKNMVRSQIRRKYFQHRSLSEPISDEERGLSHEIEEKRPDPSTDAERSEIDTIIRHAIEQLPPDEREVTVLRDIEGYAYDEISKLCKIPLGTVKSRISRARRILRLSLEPLLRR